MSVPGTRCLLMTKMLGRVTVEFSDLAPICPAGDILPVGAQEIASKVIVEAAGEVEALAGCAVGLSRGLRRDLVGQVDGGADVQSAEIESEFQACDEVKVFPPPAFELGVHAVYLEEI